MINYEALEADIKTLAHKYGESKLIEKQVTSFKPGLTPIPASGKVVGGLEVENAVAAAFDMHFTEGRFVEKFEKRIADYLGLRFASMCNSGSSANLLAITTLKEIVDRIQGRSNIITAAAGFPTTINPIIQNGFIPRFVDVEIETYVPTIDMIANAVDKDTVGIFMAHTLGNPFPIEDVLALCKEKGIHLIEDNCDALGSTYAGKLTGTFGLMSTLSLYPAHHITAGGGGGVFTKSPIVNKMINSYRDWGRDCWCKTGEDNTCGKRFEWDFPQLHNYDHKYIYSRIGYNLKSTDFQGAIALAQTFRIETFVAKRRENFKQMYGLLSGLEEFIHLPRATKNSEPSWFGFPITVREPNICVLLTKYLESHKIGTRRLFGGNLLKQPAYSAINASVTVPNTDIIADNTFWVGIWPGLTSEMVTYTANKIIGFFRSEI
ncbi:hypothetical protein LCGC14_0508740 [marine sediment metagenome]|uniref:Lipopolysaccharide biosynthesis protein RfbH n=1 Tax=marine sediment metagenome TaxID=412755 RepID=A0A0F9S1W9_9ZZZZ